MTSPPIVIQIKNLSVVTSAFAVHKVLKEHNGVHSSKKCDEEKHSAKSGDTKKVPEKMTTTQLELT